MDFEKWPKIDFLGTFGGVFKILKKIQIFQNPCIFQARVAECYTVFGLSCVIGWESLAFFLSNEVFPDFFGHLERFLGPLKHVKKWTFFHFCDRWPRDCPSAHLGHFLT